jgi:hypothetical protein
MAVMSVRRLGVVALLVLAVAVPACKKKKTKAVDPTPSEFISTPGAVSENAALKCDAFAVADSAKARSVVALLAKAAAPDAKNVADVACFLGGPILTGKAPAGLIDPAKANTLAEKGDFMPFDIVKARGQPPHWATQVPDATDCQALSKDGVAVYFCKIVDVYRIVQVENLGPG